MKRLLPILLGVLVAANGCVAIEFDNFGNIAEFKNDADFGKIDYTKVLATLSGERIFTAVNPVHIEIVGHDIVGTYWKTDYQVHQLSGVIINYGGKPHILTAAHACPSDFRVKSIFVYFRNAKSPPEEAELVLRDKSGYMDFALFRFVRKNFQYDGPIPPIGSSQSLQHGEKIYVLGSPLGIPFSISQGVVVNREFSKYILYDALGNPGNSGGPVVNERGEVVGITVAGLRTGGLFNPFITTIPAALPIDDIVTVLRRAKKGGEITHPHIGIGVIDSAEMNAIDFKERGIARPKREGVMVLSAGNRMEVGDVIIACDGASIQDDWQLIKKLTLEYDAGDRVPLAVDRYGILMTIVITLQE